MQGDDLMNKKSMILITGAIIVAFVVGYFVGDAAAVDKVNKQISIHASNNSIRNNTKIEPEELPETITVVSLPTELENKDCKVTLKGISQDADSLKVYVTYENKTNKTMHTADSLCKVIVNGTQYEFDTGFNFDRYYKMPVAHAPGTIEPSVKADSVIFLKPIPNIDRVNIVLSANIQNFKFNDVKVEIK